MNNKEKVRGIQVYPECADGDGILGVGDVSDILSDTDSYHENNEYAVLLYTAYCPTLKMHSVIISIFTPLR